MKKILSEDAGDVPGWVLITLMTAGLVVLMWSVAGPALKGVFDQALSKVTSFLKINEVVPREVQRSWTLSSSPHRLR